MPRAGHSTRRAAGAYATASHDSDHRIQPHQRLLLSSRSRASRARERCVPPRVPGRHPTPRDDNLRRRRADPRLPAPDLPFSSQASHPRRQSPIASRPNPARASPSPSARARSPDLARAPASPPRGGPPSRSPPTFAPLVAAPASASSTRPPRTTPLPPPPSTPPSTTSSTPRTRKPTRVATTTPTRPSTRLSTRPSTTTKPPTRPPRRIWSPKKTAACSAAP